MAKLCKTIVNNSTESPKYGKLLDISPKMIFNQWESKIPFEFNIGFCKSNQHLINDLSKFPENCPLDEFKREIGL